MFQVGQWPAQYGVQVNGAGAAHLVMGAGGPLLQPDEFFRRAGLLPVDGVGVGDVDRGRHGHLGILGGKALDQLDILE